MERYVLAHASVLGFLFGLRTHTLINLAPADLLIDTNLQEIILT